MSAHEGSGSACCVPKRRENAMSLLIPNGTPIPVPAPAPSGKVLNLKRFEQDQDAWCYAACARMVLHFFTNDSVTQCDVVSFVKHGDCCANETSDTCNGSGAKVEEITPMYANFGISSVRKQ